jgi:hypothetical protein
MFLFLIELRCLIKYIKNNRFNYLINNLTHSLCVRPNVQYMVRIHTSTQVPYIKILLMLKIKTTKKL